MTMQTGQQSPVDSGATPLPDPEAAQWAELAKEVGVEPGGEPESEAAAEPSEPVAEAPAEPAARPAPTELDNLKTALREAREAHKAEQARTDSILAALREAKERRGQPESAKQEQPALPDVQADPIGHMQARFAQLEQLLAQTHQGGQQQTQQIAQHLQEQAMWSTVERSEVEIRDPKSAGYKADYDEACQHLEGGRVRQLDAMYPSDSPQVQAMARQQGFQDANRFKLALLNQDRRAVATHALQMGTSPAQLYYDLAVRAGYQPKTNGQAAPNGVAERASQVIAAAKKGTKASVTLSGGDGGRKGPNDMTQSDLADLFIEDPAMADKVWEQMRKSGKLG